MNYARARNPQHLLQRIFTDPQKYLLAAGAEGLHLTDRKTEALFIRQLHTLSHADLQPLIIVVGGFKDGLQGHAYRIIQNFPLAVHETHDIYYREHYEGRQVRELVELYRHRGLAVSLIGHSWGGDAVVHAVAMRTAATIDMLMTLDPVSRKPIPQHTLANVRHWVNVYVDYTKVSTLHSSNIVARIGGPWELVPAATVNLLAPGSINHENTLGLFAMTGGVAKYFSY